ncbi:unannotated protein [freshwater metagenome]|uniref:Unannotated protein n=1 Tax=freshwater metagenome TaxID=449393 RepID=A0A6J7F1R2_9ZZZZ|nr:alpha/beta fold hydrolase [Actinomycetota bacterium]MSY26436.1 alpha/beta fold hydrolase [Actinomycetota bacterium]MTB13509.1 alpha/beta fold hydrolase [Actinomycetota bacterium]MTB24347.1 alpha/beta fold hydrolase [Actinomycetota bacterium]
MALDSRPTSHRVSVQGALINSQAWGEVGNGGLILVHGGAAHARWWDFIAPLLAPNKRVLAIDLSGHGDSANRDAYSLDLWAEELMAVALAGGVKENPIIIGHSMGGLVGLKAGRDYGREIAGVITIDSPVRKISPENDGSGEGKQFGALRVYESKEDIVGRFRTIPEQATLPFAQDYVASVSIREVSGGWVWKFDPNISKKGFLPESDLHQLGCQVAIFRAEHGLVPMEMGELMRERLGAVLPVKVIRDSGHAIMLDKPLELIYEIQKVLDQWAQVPEAL